ncbi:PHD finger protein 6-like isoform X2 [Polypterus senegalus]|uniref:PHD finger protein 6-like isoform X2 n=1 Tax=Polypterus senegalus TaxID=55291 RepID=UPI0019630055|nr:PHD finger protein 6-like isoform X2 [Polypterus senegalus]
MARKKPDCGFCKQAGESDETGPLLGKAGVFAHEFCMLYSSNLITKREPEGDDFAGFLVEDVKEELKRGQKLHCYSCKKTGATIGCEIKKCKKSYHYPCAKEQKAITIENKVKGTFELYCKDDAKLCPEGSGKRTDRDAVSSDIKEPKEVKEIGSRSLNRSQTMNSRKRKKPTEMFQSDSETVQLSDDSASSDHTLDCIMSKNDEDEDKSESSLDPMLSKPQCSPGNEAEFWQLCNKTGCVEKIFSKIKDELTNVSMKITNHSASDNDYKFAFAVTMASGLLLQIMSENEAETEAKLESLQAQQNLLTQAKSAMQEVKTKMDQWHT